MILQQYIKPAPFEIAGAELQHSPLGNEEMPEVKTIKERIQSLIKRSKDYWDDQQKKEDELFDKILGT